MDVTRRAFWSRFLDERGAIGSVDDPTPGGGGQAEPGTGDPSPSGAGDGSSDSTPAPITLTDTSLVQVPGSDKAIPWTEFLAEYVPKGDHTKVQDALNARTSAEDLVTRAEAVQQARAAAQPAAAPAGAPAAPADYGARFRDNAFISGKVLDDLYNSFMNGDIKPLYKWGESVNTVVAQLSEAAKKLDTRVGSFEAVRDTKQQSDDVSEVASGALKAGGIDLALDHFGPVASPLRDFATSIYYSWDPGHGQTRAQYDAAFPDHFATALTQYRDAFRQLDRIEAAEARRVKIPGRGGGASPSGAAPDTPMTAREIARAVFAGRAARST